MLVVGSDSQIGRALSVAAASHGHDVWQTTRRPERIGGRSLSLDLSGDVAHWPLPPEVPNAAVFCGAVTSIKACEEHPSATRAVNVDAVAVLAKRLADAGTFVVFLSSNQVFNGRTAFAAATDAPDPQTEYGRQKADAEAAVLGLGERAAVLRLSKVVATGAAPFADWAARLVAGETVQPFHDMVVSPVSIDVVVTALLRLVETRASGVMQLSANADLTYADVATRLGKALGASPSCIVPRSHRDAGVSFSPRHTTLDSTRAEQELGVPAPDAWQAIERHILEPARAG